MAISRQVVNFEYDPKLRHLVQGNDASIEQIIQEIIQTSHGTYVPGARPESEQESPRFGQPNGRSEVEPLKERCRRAEFEIVNLLHRVQDAQEGANRFSELERELKFAKERIEKLELRGVQTTEMHQQSMNQLGERLAKLETQPQSLSQLPVSGNSATDSLKEEHGRRIQELRTSALIHPRNWENPVLGIQAEQKAQRAQWEELNQMYNQVRNQYHGLPKDLGRQQDKIDRLPIETMEEKYRKLESRLGEIQRLGTQPIRDKITSSGLHSIQSTPIQSDSTHSNPMHSDWTQSNPAASNPTNATRLNSNPTHGIDSITGQSNLGSRDGLTH